MKQLIEMLKEMDNDLGIIGDIIGAICLFGIGYVVFMLAYGWGVQ